MCQTDAMSDQWSVNYHIRHATTVLHGVTLYVQLEGILGSRSHGERFVDPWSRSTHCLSHANNLV